MKKFIIHRQNKILDIHLSNVSSKTIQSVNNCGFCDRNDSCDCNQIIIPSQHYCYDSECNWDCGTLSCGCIDICRGRCEFDNVYDDRYW